MPNESGPDEPPTAVDPLEALRAADMRPIHERLRDRIRESASPTLTPAVRRRAWTVLAVLIVLLVVRTLIVEGDPPIEESLPFANPDQSVAAPATPVETISSGIVASPATAPAAEVVVHVAGAVRRPGIVTGTAGWRVADAIEAAGGARAEADLDRVNLAALIADAERIYVPELGEELPPDAEPRSGESAGPVDINSADIEALQTVPGIGPVTAATIVDHRTEHGPFASVDALVAVRGIGSATVESIRDHVTVG